MMHYTDLDPTLGSAAVLDALRDDLAAHAQAVTAVSDTAQTTLAMLDDGVWSGATATAWRTRATTCGEQAAALAAQIDTVTTALAAHADVVADITIRAQPYLDALRTARIEQAMLQDPAYTGTVEAFDEPQRLSVRLALTERVTVDASLALSALAALRRERDASAADVVRAVNQDLPDTWPAEYAALVAGSSTSPYRLHTGIYSNFQLAVCDFGRHPRRWVFDPPFTLIRCFTPNKWLPFETGGTCPVPIVFNPLPATFHVHEGPWTPRNFMKFTDPGIRLIRCENIFRRAPEGLTLGSA